MNLSLGFPELSQELALARKPSLEAVVSKYHARRAEPDSPVRAIHHQPASEGVFSGMPEGVDARLRGALEKRGIRSLYSHQAEAFGHVAAGKNVVIVTPTASGKTLCYNLPVLNHLLTDANARAMYLFPTKALSEDQLHEFNAAVNEMGSEIKAFTYDGDTPQDARKAIRQRANVALTNPDMLHAGILPHHTKWARFFESLKYIVIDELHYYRGVYGSHLSNVLRRLARICEFYGSKPQFICCSATIANPKDLAQSLVNQPFELVESNGAPRGEKFFVMYNPPVVNRQLGIRRSYIAETRRLAMELIERDLQTLVFANNRLATEVLVKYLKDACEKSPVSGEPVRGYRGGYLPKERREIERKLRDGEIRAVVATNALELGIDIGSLDAVVMAGYPGTIASSWQRAGRAGRRQGAAIAILVATSAPTDQYIVEHPEYFFGRPPEHAYVNADNLEILMAHLKCAAFELPLREGELYGGHDTTELNKYLEETGLFHHSGGAWHWTSDTYPADATSLRAVTSDNFVVIDITQESQVIAEVPFPAALTALHEKAIYMHEARLFHVETFDYDQREAWVKKVDCDYYTQAIEYTQVKTLTEAETEAFGGAQRVHGDVRVNNQVVGFKKIKFYTNENVGAGKLNMPEQEMHTTSFWLHFPAAFLEALGDYSPTERQSGILAMGNAMRTVASLLLMCDPRDLGIALSDPDDAAAMFEPNLYLYDAYPGGIGQSAPLYRMAARLVENTAGLIGSCQCENGCPSCVGAAGEVGGRGKEVAAKIVARLLAGQLAPSEQSA